MRWLLRRGLLGITVITLATPLSAQVRAEIQVDANVPLHKIDRGIFGQFIEHYGRVVEHGVWAELLQNRKFYPFNAVDQMNVAAPWTGEPDRQGVSYAIDRAISIDGISSQRIVLSGPTNAWRGIRQGGFEVVGGKEYVGRVWLKAQPPSRPAVIVLETPNGETLARSEFAIQPNDWHQYDFKLKPAGGLSPAIFRILFNQPGIIWIAAASLMPADNIDGIRKDVVELARTMAPPILRWPGGGFPDTYDWRKVVGPRDPRPPQSVGVYANPDGFDSNVDPSDFGTDEYIRFCRLIGARPYITVNFGSGDPELARQWVEYCNGAADSPLGARRAANGHPEPYNVKDWGVGNESWLSIEPGYSTPEGYAMYFNQFAEAMRRADPTIRIVAVGDTLGAPGNWDETIARISGQHADFLSVHYYFGLGFLSPFNADHPVEFYRAAMAAPVYVEQALRQTVADLDRFTPPGRRIQIAFDEWNEANYGLAPPGEPKTFSLKHLVETIIKYGGEINQPFFDALFSARMLHVFMRTGDRVVIGCRTHLVNSTAAIRSNSTEAHVTAPGTVMQLYAMHSGTTLLKVEQKSPTFDEPQTGLKNVPYLDANATLSADGRTLFVHLLNLEEEQAMQVRIHIAGRSAAPTGNIWQIAAESILSRNDFGVAAVDLQQHPLKNAGAEFSQELPPHSATTLELTLK